MSEEICAMCWFFNACPCGACLYGVCGNTASPHLHEYVHEDMAACRVFLPVKREVRP